MQHQLIILAGASPGAGKSTLSELLFDQFTRQQLPTHWIYEEDILHAETFRPVVHVFQHGQGDAIATILAATAQFVQESLQAKLVTITDSIFPCYTWLVAAGYSPMQIAEFSQQLAHLLSPLQPLLIYLNSDVAHCLNRAVAQRGSEWLEELMAGMQNYTYSQTHPIQDSNDVVDFFKTTSQLHRALLAEWPHPVLILDTTTMPLEQLAALLLDHFGLPAQATTAMATPNELQRYVGTYTPRDTTSDPATIEIWLADNMLRINRYWPNGCRLIAEGAGRFRLQSTNRHITFDITFDEQGTMSPESLVYTYGGCEYWYDFLAL